MAMLKQLSVNCRIREKQHRFVKLFSSASDSNAADGKPSNPPPPPSPLSSSSSSSRLSDVKASLRQPSPPRKFSSPPPLKETPNFATQKPSKIASLEEIQKNLSEFRRRSAAPLRGGEGEKPSAAQPLSFQELYKSNVMDKGKEEEGKLSFEAIKESLRKLSSAGNENRFRGSEKISQIPSPLSLKTLKESLKRQPVDPTVPRSPLSPLPLSIFGKELDEKASPESPALKTEFVKMYSYGELGDKLRKLRPEVRGKKNWFSLEELNQRLMKLREIEEKETESRIGGVNFKELRESLVRLRISSDASNKKSSMQRLGLLGQLGGQVTPSYMLVPPKEHLVEKYFHPDNMSSAEKLKLELKRVRDEFKMSESDCGSSRVQIAQLTTKIKNLSSALHKKDKHSRKGLQGMVQRRKKLLKYLRRTDWESYCFVLNKLGLRDNPYYKN